MSAECKVRSVNQTLLRSLLLCNLQFALCTRHFALCCGFTTRPSAPVEFRARAIRWFLSLLLLALSGCGKNDSSLAEVRGDVTFCGQPAVAEISFELLNAAGKAVGRASTATSDESGRFRLMLDESQPGAKIGRNRVAIRVQRMAPSREAGEKSKSSRDGVIGTLKATQVVRDVQTGGNQFHFRLTY